MPKLSIIVPVYKVERYIERCISSLRNQTLTDIEIILVDDGSPDLCPQLCDEYAQKDSRIKVIHKANAGLGYARNSGLEIATGEYVAFVDSDDYADVQMYDKLYVAACREHADAVFCGFSTENREEGWIKSNEVDKNKVWRQDDIRTFMLDMIASAPHERKERKFQMSVWHAIYKRTVITENNIKFPSERDVGSEDLPFQVDFLKKSNVVSYIKGWYYFYCFNNTSLTKTFKKSKFQCYKNLRNLLISKINDQDSMLRINRLFIGYSRSYIRNLLNSNTSNKKDILRNLMADDVWPMIYDTYRVNYLPWNSRIYYYLIIRKRLNSLIVYNGISKIVKMIIKGTW